MSACVLERVLWWHSISLCNARLLNLPETNQFCHKARFLFDLAMVTGACPSRVHTFTTWVSTTTIYTLLAALVVTVNLNNSCMTFPLRCSVACFTSTMCMHLRPFLDLS